MPLRWDIFCTVVDNYGDIGIAWRLARQMAVEHDLSVRLWVDDLTSFAKLRPEIDPVLAEQVLAGVEVRFWPKPFPHAEPAEVVIEALACHLPEEYVEAMAVRTKKPVWINLEYLSAEAWVTGCHALPSPHPRLPLTKYFFFPGWHEGAGVLQEADLDRARLAFLASAQEQAAFWRRLGLFAPQADELCITLFSYENHALPTLLDAWAAGGMPIRCLVPIGPSLAGLATHFGLDHAAPGTTVRRGKLTLHVLPWLAQDEYDRLLWLSDCNFVRGEDSFVRAQWARAPFVWQAYRQERGAHWAKIEAFLERYCEGMAAEATAALRRFWTAWNREEAQAGEWRSYWQHRAELCHHANDWAGRMARLGDLATNLVKFAGEKDQ
jgi:uncharacterized repeat protein (TIGR03837 family)